MFEVVREWDHKQQADLGIVGLPFDGGVVTGRQGTRLGPKGVRDTLYANTAFNVELEADLSKLKIVDCGDVRVDMMDATETYRRVELSLAQVFKSGICPLIIGGDHSLTSYCIKGLTNTLGDKKRVGLIDFDAHFDCRASMKGPQSGYWVREALEIPGSPIRGENIAQIGVHGFRYSPYYLNYVKKSGIRTYTPLDVRRKGMETVVREAIDAATDGTDAVYVSVDIDVLDTAFAPGCASSYVGGLSTLDLLSGVVEVGKNRSVRALDIMEIAPPLDVGTLTSKAGAEILLEFACGFSLRQN